MIESAAAANVGSIFGIEYPPLHGRTVQFMPEYEGGLTGFVARARELAAADGPLGSNGTTYKKHV